MSSTRAKRRADQTQEHEARGRRLRHGYPDLARVVRGPARRGAVVHLGHGGIALQDHGAEGRPGGQAGEVDAREGAAHGVERRTLPLEHEVLKGRIVGLAGRGQDVDVGSSTKASRSAA